MKKLFPKTSKTAIDEEMTNSTKQIMILPHSTIIQEGMTMDEVQNVIDTSEEKRKKNQGRLLTAAGLLVVLV